MIGFGAYGAYGLYEWNRAEDSLKLKGKTIEELSSIFDHIDEDKSGSISLSELDHALNQPNTPHFGKIQLKAMMKKADVNHDGMISRDEFLNLCEELHTSTHIPILPKVSLPNPFDEIKKDGK